MLSRDDRLEAWDSRHPKFDYGKACVHVDIAQPKLSMLAQGVVHLHSPAVQAQTACYTVLKCLEASKHTAIDKRSSAILVSQYF